MITRETLRAVILSQRAELLLQDTGVEREELHKIKLTLPFALVLSGVRRCGKSTLMRQLMKHVKEFYYFNFEDSRVANFEVSDFEKMNDIFLREYGAKEYYFFDEIQNVLKWELFVRKLVDSGKHVIITGSNASLLSKELGTRLTGRHLNYELFPFSYTEFLDIIKEKQGASSFRDYLMDGGFPEYLKTKRAEVLQELFNDILMRDISVRYKVRNLKTLRELAVFLMTNVGKEFSYNALKKLFNLGSINSVISFISHLEDSYMLFTIPKFDYSLKKRIVSHKKVYSVDNGLSGKNSASFSEDKGRMLENAVFQNLRKRYKDIFYFKKKNECDFIVREGVNITRAIQVCYVLDSENMDRELKGLTEALAEFKLKTGMILTFDQEDEIAAEGYKIIVKPVWKWLME